LQIVFKLPHLAHLVYRLALTPIHPPSRCFSLFAIHLTANPPKPFTWTSLTWRTFFASHGSFFVILFWSKHGIPPSLHPSPCDHNHQRASMGCLVGASVRLSTLPYRPLLVMVRSSPPRLSHSDMYIIEPWWLHLVQHTPKVIDLYLRTNINFFCCLLHIDAFIKLYRLDISFPILRTQNLNEHHQLDTNFACKPSRPYLLWYQLLGNMKIPPMTSSLWDQFPRAHKMNIKSYKKKSTKFNVVRPKLGLHPRGENLREYY